MNDQHAMTLEPRTLSELERVAAKAAISGLFGVKTEESALMVMLTGASLGIPTIAALRGIHIVSGRPTLSSDLLVGVVLRSGLCESWDVIESTPERCEIITRRKGAAKPARHVWTIEMAKKAGLAGKSGPWSQYPHSMLRARCSAEIARMVYPDVLFGVYVEGEIASAPADNFVRAEVTQVTPSNDDAPQLVDRVDPIETLSADLAAATTLRMVLDAWQRSAADITRAARGDAARDAVREWIVARLDIIVASETTPLLSNAMGANDTFCAFFDTLVGAPDVSAVLTAWRERGDLGVPWFRALAYRMAGRTLKSLGVKTDDAKRMLNDDGPDGDGGKPAEVVEALKDAPGRALASGDATAAATAERLITCDNRSHLFNSAKKHASEILANALVLDLYAATLRRITAVDPQDTRTTEELDAAARDLVRMWATQATQTAKAA